MLHKLDREQSLKIILMMNPPENYKIDTIGPRQQNMLPIYDDLLKIGSELSNSSVSFLLFWNENFHISFHKTEGIKLLGSSDFELLKQNCTGLKNKVYFTANKRHHTLFQSLQFFENYQQYPQLKAYSIIDDSNKCVGLFGHLYKKNESVPLENDGALSNLQSHIQKLYINNLPAPTEVGDKKPLYLGSLDQLPGAHFEYSINTEGDLCNFFVSKEALEICSQNTAQTITAANFSTFELLHHKTFNNFKNDLDTEQHKQSLEYAFQATNEGDKIDHYLVRINTFRNDADELLCFGAIKNISLNSAYDAVLEQIIFDISHVIRRPVATMLGLTNLIEQNMIEADSIQDISFKLKLVSQEMDDYIKTLYAYYQQRKDEFENSDKELLVIPNTLAHKPL